MAPTPSVDPAFLIEHMQEDLAKLRKYIVEPGPLSIGERAATAHHIQVIAASLGILHNALRTASREDHVEL